ncbi:MAG: hypothetical protein HYX75_03650 [Acidobacteria bacterium]|nr:hypothetical protein [Acidobacteriota bacterium]
MTEQEIGLGEAIAALRQDLKKRLAPLNRAVRALDALAANGALDKLEVLDEHSAAVRDADLTPFGLGESQAAVAEQLVLLHDRLKTRARVAVLSDLTRLGAGIEITQLTEHPLTVLISPMVAELDVSAGRAHILYAREMVDDVDLDARLILESREKAMAHIRQLAADSVDFFDTALRAYRTVLVARGLGLGDRIDIVDMLAPLALLRADVSVWRKTNLQKVAPYPRYLLAFQLQKLQRDGLLVKDGLRIELGTATGGSTRNKQDVIFVPTSPTEGQYYLSVRFLAQ